LKAGQGQPVVLEVKRNGALTAPLTIHPAYMPDGSSFPWKIGFMGRAIDGATRTVPLSFPVAMERSKQFCHENSTLIVHVLGKLFVRQVSVKQLSGPVGIAVVAGQAAESKGWIEKFELAAAISLNLGILNLLPFPILDGGLILFLLIESAIRRDISLAIKERIYQAAFVVIVVFFAFVIFNDVSRLSIFTHGKP
jgi:regulator of sigma E protease